MTVQRAGSVHGARHSRAAAGTGAQRAAARPEHAGQQQPGHPAGQERRGGPAASTTIPAADCPMASPRVAAVTTQPKASVAVPAGAAVSTAIECAVTCGVISAPAASMATVSTTSEPLGPGQRHRRDQHRERRRAAPASAGAAGAARAAASRARRPAPRSPTRPRSAPRRGPGEPAAAVTAGTPTSTVPIDHAEPQRGERDGAHGRPAQRAEQAERGPAAAAARWRADRAAEREAQRPEHHRQRGHHQAGAGPRRQHQERRERRADDEEDLQADRLVGVGRVPAAGRAAAARPTGPATRPAAPAGSAR